MLLFSLQNSIFDRLIYVFRWLFFKEYSLDCYFRQKWRDERLRFTNGADFFSLNIKMLDNVWKVSLNCCYTFFIIFVSSDNKDNL